MCISTLSVSWRGMCDGCNCLHMKVKEGSMQRMETKETEGIKERKGAGEDFELGRGRLTCLFEEEGGLTIGLGGSKVGVGTSQGSIQVLMGGIVCRSDRNYPNFEPFVRSRKHG